MQYAQKHENPGMDHTKLAPCELGATNSEAHKPLPVRPSTTAGSPESPEIPEPATAVEAVRYLFLAKELRRLGQADAADRWHAKAVAWLGRLSSSDDEST